MNRRSLLAASAAALAACAGPRAKLVSSPVSLASDITAAAEKAMSLGVAPGLSIAIYSRGETYARGFGAADLATGERASADTAFYIASSTKSLTSLALACLHERREFDLDATLGAYAPDANFPASTRPGEARFRNLLAHTGGIDNAGIGFRLAYSGLHDPETLWRLLAASEPNAKAPLGRFAYTNLGYNIATILTDRKLGVRWQDLLQREIFAPAGMSRSSATMSRAAAGGWSIAKPHMGGPDGRVTRIDLQKTDQTMQSAGGVIMSANDAVRWLELMVEDGRIGGRQIVPAAAIAASRAPLAQVGDVFEGYKRDKYGLGWYLGDYRGELMLHDFGSFPGFRAHVSYQPRRGMGVAAFVNDSTLAFPLVDAIANFAYDRAIDRSEAGQRYDSALKDASEQADKQVRARAADRSNRAKRAWTLARPRSAYAGAYENEAFGRVEVTLEGEAIHLRCGVLHSVAEPYTQPESVRVEIIPGAGTVVTFEGTGASPQAMVLQGQRLARVN